MNFVGLFHFACFVQAMLVGAATETMEIGRFAKKFGLKGNLSGVLLSCPLLEETGVAAGAPRNMEGMEANQVIWILERNNWVISSASSDNVTRKKYSYKQPYGQLEIQVKNAR